MRRCLLIFVLLLAGAVTAASSALAAEPPEAEIYFIDQIGLSSGITESVRDALLKRIFRFTEEDAQQLREAMGELRGTEGN